MWASIVAAPGLWSGVSVVVGARAELLCSMWALLGAGIEPVFPALAGGFFTTELPAGKATREPTAFSLLLNTVSVFPSVKHDTCGFHYHLLLWFYVYFSGILSLLFWIILLLFDLKLCTQGMGHLSFLILYSLFHALILLQRFYFPFSPKD